VVEEVAAVFRPDEGAYEVFSRFGAALLDESAEVGEQLFAALVCSEGDVHTLDRSEGNGDLHRLGTEEITPFRLDAEQLSYDSQREGIGELRDGVDVASGGRFVKEIVHDELNARRESADGAGSEGLGDERAEARVIGWVGDEHGGWVALLGGEAIVVAEYGCDLGVAREYPASAGLVPMDGIGLAQTAVVEVGVSEEGWGEPGIRGVGLTLHT
jgi:hypothetical protein